MDQGARQALDALSRALEAATDLQACLHQADVIYRKAIRKIEAGGDFQATMERAYSSGAAHRVGAALNRLAEDRHQSRIQLIAVALASGLSIGEVARNWGVSRQLASRYAKEARSRA